VSNRCGGHAKKPARISAGNFAFYWAKMPPIPLEIILFEANYEAKTLLSI
jgi:hypothetical protein